MEELQRLSQTTPQAESTNSEFVAKTCELVEFSLKKQEKLMTFYSNIVRDLDKHHSEAPKLLRDLYRLSAFKFVSGTNLYFGTQEIPCNENTLTASRRLGH
jgi:hypothetical protein